MMDIPINNETYNGHGMGQYPGLRRSSRRFVTNTNLTSRNRHIWQPSGSRRDVNLEEDIDRAQSG